eukprot:TRINITY_DN36811_c0_g1_i1.p1 TRINITY_DN36811_c0_g1~~TRINITY_DN36811_c0_g1_i1.p1  ORF type:complete len:404 (+),score=60.89 TRINITY_DN36811_c0_g1_i1:25-1212(+)
MALAADGATVPEGFGAVPGETRTVISPGNRCKGATCPSVTHSRAQASLEEEHQLAQQKADPDPEICSISSELDCPICYHHFVEPVLAGCGRHTFCRNCLLKSQTSQAAGTRARCPVCRVECPRSALDSPEVARIATKLRTLEGEGYEERVQESRQEREEHLDKLRLAAALQDARPRNFCVVNAGVAEVNGIYIPGVLPSYVGPTVYRKPNSYMCIYRWHQSLWIIAELQDSSSMGETQHMFYWAPVDYPAEYPPVHGWEIPSNSRLGQLPAPEVRLATRNLNLRAAHSLNLGDRPIRRHAASLMAASDTGFASGRNIADMQREEERYAERVSERLERAAERAVERVMTAGAMRNPRGQERWEAQQDRNAAVTTTPRTSPRPEGSQSKCGPPWSVM